MKNHLQNLFLVLIGAGILAMPATAQTFITLHSFTAGTGSFPNVINSDGANPFGQLLLSGDTLCGTSITGGSSESGAVFKIKTSGSGFAILYEFTGGNDGANPEGGLIVSGNILYGQQIMAVWAPAQCLP